MGERIFSRYAYGIEGANTHGTIVNATHVLVGADQKAIPEDWKPVFPEDNLGIRMRSSRSLKSELLVEDSISIARMYFEALPFFLLCGLAGGVTDTNYVWDFTPSLNTTNDPDSFTLEAGDDTQAFVMEYGMFKSLKISGDIDQGGGESPVKIDAPYFARQVAKQNFTSGLTLGAYTGMSAKLAHLYYAADLNSLDTNAEVTDTLRSFELELQFGNHPKFFGSDNLFFDTHGEGFLDAMLTLTLEGNSAVNGMWDDWDNQTYKAVRLEITGPEITNTNTNHSFIVDIFGQWEMIKPINAESAGNNITQALFHGLADPTLVDSFSCSVVTDVNL